MTAIQQSLSEKLKAINPLLVPEDRKEACMKFFRSYSTVQNYLLGRVRNEGFGLELLEFFNDRITQRAERLKAIA